MRRLWAWLAGGAGGVAAYKTLRRRPRTAVMESAPSPDVRAEELRAKLAETREPEPPEDPADADSRRRAVHDQARAALEEMQGE